ncbi:hypothetical protein TSUD_240420 [Trifolium subterraneum]|uniref:Uncharacterized protein n=1 Tax=Trifolium subterraneum TaxID=3900 RepID=A0A2Z6NFF9_TRISU|nr:hypothetical protein TSUD_240420 [Trifolium subterraneum]
MAPLRPIPFKYFTSTGTIDKVMRAFASSVLSKKLGFTKDQISCLTDDEINYHLETLLPFISMAEKEQLLTFEVDQLSIVERICFSVGYNNSKENLFSPLRPLVSIFIPEIPLLTDSLPTTPPPKIELFAGGTFALIGVVLVWITVKMMKKRDSGTTIVAQEPLQLSEETLSEYKYSASPNLKGYKGFVETYRRKIKQEIELDQNGTSRAVVPSNRFTADQMTHVQTRRSNGIEISRPDGAVVYDEYACRSHLCIKVPH